MEHTEDIETRQRGGLCCYTYGRKFVCDHRAIEGKYFCVAHVDKRTPEEDKEFRRLFDEQVAVKHQRLDFRGWKFPANFKFPPVFHAIADFSKARFLGNADFRNVRFAQDVVLHGAAIDGWICFGNGPVTGQVSLRFARIGEHLHVANLAVMGGMDCLGVTITGDVHILSRELRGEISFKSAEIGGGVSLETSHVAGNIIFDHAQVGERKGCWGINLNHVHVKGKLSLTSAVVAGRVSMEEAIVDGPVDCSFLTTGKSLHCWKAKFGVRAVDAISFYGARIGDHAGFHGTEFHTDLNFRDAEIRTKLNFTKALFKGDVSFEGTSAPPAGIFDPPGDFRVQRGKGMWLYRIAKQIYQNMGRYDEAGDYHYMERRDAWDARNPWWSGHLVSLCERIGKFFRALLGRRIAKCSRWAADQFELVVIRGVCGYFERPRRIAFAAAIAILSCGMVYWAFGSVGASGDNAAGFLGAMYFSVVTFTTLGFGDIKPIRPLSGRLVAGGEALVGAFLIAAFLVTLARRWGRG